MKLKIADIDEIGTLRTVMEAVMDGATTAPSVVTAAVPRLLDGDVARKGGPEAIVEWALSELKRRGAIENGDGELRVIRPRFTVRGSKVEVLPRGTREKLSRAGHAQFQAARVWKDVVRYGQLPRRSTERHDLVASIGRNGFQPHLGKILVDEHGVVINGRGRMWALGHLDIPVSPAFVTRREYGEGMEADAHRLADSITANIGQGLSGETFKAIAARVLPEGGKLDDLCGVLGYSHVSMGLKREVALELHEQGMSNRAVARALGVSHPTVMRWVVRDVPPGGGSQIESGEAADGAKINDPELRDKVVALRSQDWKRDEICEELGIAHGTLTAIEAVIRASNQPPPPGTCRICGHEPHECV